ncbi:MAG: S-methyl-5-thioribose-1-phosphate isomerase [Prolixibacteraceae bacterium]|nr:S-methyl-5-thioribose-1-phosphate isomerase [Prolixibacteraceae bacterium]MBT6007551.1 S-methyl-5-thioribose-1-phosphate isomerase [Prolixibacteraceae bacterium]MBT6765028.1 S-methyl-5-thioribose-1-phosphate isomerase [Prolixibacteraceae bacterium]MBT6998951.1 S-methyl-5-thioribose-1-phosphate isomerase [Prolixibacteraceae bacterium]MBT7393900.1 S-methyl-5-thioribose-1-phosphate isomerase [Prolixibacteraceae bacterium]
MKIQGKQYHTIWLKEGDSKTVQVIDQRKLPFQFEVVDLKTTQDSWFAINEMVVRGAPLIGVTAAFGIYIALLEFQEGNLETYLIEKADYLKSSRPTAVNLAFAVEEMLKFILQEKSNPKLIEKTLEKANQLKEKEIQFSEKIGEFGVNIIEEIYETKKDTVNILTHCNAGWLACIDWGTATAPMYKAHLKGIPVHVWVDETRPRNQGARLTAFELGEEGIPHTVIPDNTGGHLMQHGKVDLVIVGSDRTTINGDVANKIGTYLKALAAKDNNIPFYVALPSSTFDWELEDGIKEIPIELRDSKEVSEIEGWTENGVQSVRLIPKNSKVANYGFDVTPARLVTGLITERGICEAQKDSILKLFPEKNY